MLQQVPKLYLGCTMSPSTSPENFVQASEPLAWGLQTEYNLTNIHLFRWSFCFFFFKWGQRRTGCQHGGREPKSYYNNDQLCLVQAHMLNGPARKLLVVNRQLCYNWLDRRDASCHQVSCQPSMLAGKAELENRLQDTSPETKKTESENLVKTHREKQKKTLKVNINLSPCWNFDWQG